MDQFFCFANGWTGLHDPRRRDLYHGYAKPKTKWPWFFEVAGKNPLAIYLFSELLANVLSTINIGEDSLFSWIYEHGFSFMQRIGVHFSLQLCLCWCAGVLDIGWIKRRSIYGYNFFIPSCALVP
jgi:predicted acyltransferase